MASTGEGQLQANRSIANPMYLGTGDPGLAGGGTYTGSNTQPTLEQYENIFGPAARDIKLDQQRGKYAERIWPKIIAESYPELAGFGLKKMLRRCVLRSLRNQK